MVELSCSKLSSLDEVEARYGDWSLQHDRLMLQVEHRLQQLENWADEVDDGVLHGHDGLVDKGSGAWHPLTPSWMPCGRGSVGALRSAEFRTFFYGNVVFRS